MIKATPEKCYETEYTKSGLLLATNAYMFTQNNASPEDSYIKMQAKGKDLHVMWKRDAEGKRDKWGNPTNNFVAAFPCLVQGTLNGRETCKVDDQKKLKGKRQYDYPAYNLEQVADIYGAPVMLKNLSSASISAKLEGDFYGANGFLDMYLHDTTYPGHLPGYEGTINGITGSPTKGFNINLWLKYPEQMNGSNPLANGWSGAVPIKLCHIDSRNVQVCLKIERVGDNEFAYISLVPESCLNVKWCIKTIMDWAQRDLSSILKNSAQAQSMLKTMKNPPTEVRGDLVLCGFHLGTEIWWSRGNKESEIIWRNPELEINGRRFNLVSSSVDADTRPVEPSADRPPKKPARPTSSGSKEKPTESKRKPSEESIVETDPISITVSKSKDIPLSEGAHITGMGRNPKCIQHYTDSPLHGFMGVKKGQTYVNWTDATGAKWKTKFIVS